LTTIAASGAKAGELPADELLSKLFGGPVAQRLDVAREASPVTHISKQDPPFLIAHGTHDELVPIDQSVKFHAELRREGVDSTFIRVQGGGHNVLVAPGLDERVKLFFERHLLDRNVTIPDNVITLQPN
ncbi:MAG: prolyl oligopeptidase family serine peptidase, partial [Planctomycetaceae bacterium]|nr:prolyl oligopeptidase family serine peptidase [Planctomycetaceae bacterium]